MEKPTIENQIQPDNAELIRRNVLLEEILKEKEILLASLKGSEKQYRRLFESAKDGILIIDADTGQVDDANPFLLALIGCTYKMVYGKHLWELGVFKDIAESREAFKTLQNNQYIRYEHLPLLTLDGRHIEVEFISNVYLVDGKKVIQCNIRDITARKQAERIMTENQSKMRSILDNIGIGVALISPKMEILELNRQIRTWFPDVDTGQKPLCYNAFNDPPGLEACTNCPAVKTFLDGAVHENIRQVMQSGVRRDYRTVSSPVCNASGKVTAVIEMVEDITDRLSLESQFLQAQKLESLGRMAGGVAHDYNNMLGVILGYAELAQTKLTPLDPVYNDLQEILKAGSRSVEITRQLLGFARKQTIAPKVIDLNDNVARIIKMLAPIIGENITLNWLPGANLQPVMVDPTQLDQIMANLCVNARDAIPDIGNITVETAMVTFDKAYCDGHEGFVPGDFVCLSVGDDGSGMKMEIQKNINKATAGNGETILVVEDEAVVQKLAERMLTDLGYMVLTAGSAKEALQISEIHGHEIRLVITDVIMPEMNGRELADRLKALNPDLGILFMSGYTSDTISHLGILDHEIHFIEKPFSVASLAAKVQEVLGLGLI